MRKHTSSKRRAKLKVRAKRRICAIVAGIGAFMLFYASASTELSLSEIWKLAFSGLVLFGCGLYKGGYLT